MLRFFIIFFCWLISFNIYAANKELQKSWKIVRFNPPMVVPDNIAIYDQNNQKHYLEEYEGKTVLLVFWAPWCSICAKEMVELDRLKRDFRKLDFEILPISEDHQGIKNVISFYKYYEIRHLLAFYDYKNSLFEAMAIPGVPTSIIINTDGKVVSMITGTPNWNDNKIRKWLMSHVHNILSEDNHSYKDELVDKEINTLNKILDKNSK